MKTKYQVNEEEIKDYFPTDLVVTETLNIYQEILGLKFHLLSKEESHVWFDEVSQYSVFDQATNQFIGHFYLDLYPRDGKYGHAACFSLQRGCLGEDGKIQHPASAMVCNFTKASPEKPALLRHSEFITFFHEFGHVMHGICAQVKYSRFAGTSTERDFVECPSQMLENWCWEKVILQRVTSHYKDGTKLPEEIIQRMLAAKHANSGLLNLRQVFFGILDQTIHKTKGKLNTEELYGRLKKEITLVDHTPGTNPIGNFGHFMGGYDASYYGYLWSEVYSADLFSVFEEHGILNKEIGDRYRNLILRPGGSDDAMKYLIAFLGREPNQNAFLKSIGL